MQNSKESSYWNGRAVTYRELDLIKNKAMFYKIAFRAKSFSMSSASILDVGCGPGILTRILRHVIRHSEVMGIDISDSMINIARSENTEGVQFLCSDFLDLKLLTAIKNSFDLLVMSLFLHHQVDTEKECLERSYDLLKNNGRILIAEAIPPEDEIYDEYKRIFSLKEKRNCYTISKLTSKLRSVGFVGVRSETFPFRLRLYNWLNDVTLPLWKKKKIYELHLFASDEWKRAYKQVELQGGDFLLTCKMAMVFGQKKV